MTKHRWHPFLLPHMHLSDRTATTNVRLIIHFSTAIQSISIQHWLNCNKNGIDFFFGFWFFFWGPVMKLKKKENKSQNQNYNIFYFVVFLYFVKKIIDSTLNCQFWLVCLCLLSLKFFYSFIHRIDIEFGAKEMVWIQLMHPITMTDFHRQILYSSENQTDKWIINENVAYVGLNHFLQN